jgi:hypothetical protein
MKTFREYLTHTSYKDIFNAYYKLFLKKYNNNKVIETDLKLSKLVETLKNSAPNYEEQHVIHILQSQNSYDIHCDISGQCLSSLCDECSDALKIDLFIKDDLNLTSAEICAIILNKI